jgi:hypothetical protein
MGAALIEGHCTTAGAKEFRALKRSRPSWKLNFLPPDEFKARFYGKISG